MHAGYAATHPTRRTAGALEPTDPAPTRREGAARAAAPMSLTRAAAFLFPKTDATAPVVCAAFGADGWERCLPMGGGGGSIDVDDVIPVLALSCTVGPRSSVDGRKRQRDIRDPRVAACGGTLSTALSATLPSRLAISLLPPVLALTTVYPRTRRVHLRPSSPRGLLLAPHPSPAHRGLAASPGKCL